VTRRLTITNGDIAAGTLSEAGIAGKIIPWRDVLHEGPVDSSLSLGALSKRRARFIAERGWAGLTQASGGFAERDRAIQKLDDVDEVVLWFEDDLYDQLQLIQLLDFFARTPAKGKKVSLVVVDGYIPPLSATKIQALDASRPAVTPAQLELAKRAWKAFGSDDPAAVLSLLSEDTSALPYLAAALKRHLEEFPSLENGLSRSEYEALSAINDGHTTPVAAFLDVAKRQESVFLGDSIFWWYLERLSGRKNALVTFSDGTVVIAPTPDTSREFVKRELKLTPLGRDVLSAKKDWQALNTTRRWLGGVEIAPGKRAWRWDEGQRTLVATGPAPRKSTTSTRKRKKSTTKKKTRATARKRAPVRARKNSSRAANKRSPRRKR
jgi:hypothetical protein